MPCCDFPVFLLPDMDFCCAFPCRFSGLLSYLVLSSWEGQVLDIMMGGNNSSLTLDMPNEWRSFSLSVWNCPWHFFLYLGQFLHLICFKAGGCTQYSRISLYFVHKSCFFSTESPSKVTVTHYKFWFQSFFTQSRPFRRWFFEKLLRGETYLWTWTRLWHVLFLLSMNTAYVSLSNFRMTFLRQWPWVIDDPRALYTQINLHQGVILDM